jgi:4-hydroxy-tetrahydrodipicolinate synthase
LLPIFTGVFKTQGAMLVKAGLNFIGLPGGPMRLPLVNATDDELATLVADAAAAGIRLEAAGAAR